MIAQRTRDAQRLGTNRRPKSLLLMKNVRLFILMVIAAGMLPVIWSLGTFLR